MKSLLGIILVVLLGYGLYIAANKSANDSAKTLHVAADSTATVVGTVLVNKKDCFEESIGADAQCFLKLRVGDKDVYAIYNANDNSICKNENAATAGAHAKEGAMVRVYGFYRLDKNLDTILTCPLTDYSIQIL